MTVIPFRCFSCKTMIIIPIQSGPYAGFPLCEDCNTVIVGDNDEGYITKDMQDNLTARMKKAWKA